MSAAVPSLDRNTVVDEIGAEKVANRDTRYKEILIKQLGKNGINLFVSYSFIMVVLILLVIFTTVGFNINNMNSGDDGKIVKFAKPVITNII